MARAPAPTVWVRGPGSASAAHFNCRCAATASVCRVRVAFAVCGGIRNSEGMQRWDQLNERQEELLRRIAEGDDLSTPEGVPHRTSGRALQARGLVRVSRKGGTWRASITEAGRFYVEYGFHPDDPAHAARSSAGGSASVRRSAARTVRFGKEPSVVKLAQELAAQLTGGDGIVRIEDPDEQTRALYRRVIHAVKQHGLLPEGSVLRHTGRDRGDVVVRLYSAANSSNSEWDSFRIATRHQRTAVDEIIAALQEDPSALSVSAPLLPRALELVRLLAITARARGRRLVLNTKGGRPRLSLRLEKAQRSVKIMEECDRVPHVLTDKERRRKRREPWVRLPEYDQVPNGRLVLEINRAGHDESDTWRDDKRSKIENRLDKIMKEVEAGYRADRREQEQRERAWRERMQRWEQQKAQERAEWEQARQGAVVQAREKLRADRFKAACDGWSAAGAIRELCAAMETCKPAGEQAAGNLVRWVAWARLKADLLDPVSNPAVLVDVDFDAEPTPGDLAPFMGAWDATEPRKAYHSQQTRDHHAEIRAHEKTWHHGMRGNPQAWRWRS